MGKHPDHRESALACKKFICLRNDKLDRLGHGTFRVSVLSFFLVNLSSLLIYPKMNRFAILLFTDLGLILSADGVNCINKTFY